MEVAAKERLISVLEYYKMGESEIFRPDERLELIEGKIIQMSPIGARHAYCVGRLTQVLTQQLSTDKYLGVQNPISFGELSEPEPDLFVAKGPISKYEFSHPTKEDILLIIEVSDSTLEFDRNVKGPLYSSVEIAEYWIINTPENKIEIFKDPAEGSYQSKEVISTGQSMTSKSLNLSFDSKLILA